MKRTRMHSHVMAILAAGLFFTTLFVSYAAAGLEIIVWGIQTTPNAPLVNLTKIAAGLDHSLAMKYVCQFVLAGDVNNDCKVDLSDFALMAQNWLIDCDMNPSNPVCVSK